MGGAPIPPIELSTPIGAPTGSTGSNFPRPLRRIHLLPRGHLLRRIHLLTGATYSPRGPGDELCPGHARQ